MSCVFGPVSADYMATVDDLGVQLHQYATAHLGLQVNGESVALEMETDYPWDGQVSLKVRESSSAPWFFTARVPGWCRHYHRVAQRDESHAVVNANGYLLLELELAAGRRASSYAAHETGVHCAAPRIDAIRGCVAVQRGPLVQSMRVWVPKQDV